MNQTELDDLLSPDYMIEQLRVVFDFIDGHIRDYPQRAFAPYYMRTAKGVKPLAAVDLLAERFFMNCVARKFGTDLISIHGEESLAEDPDLRDESRTCILIDIVDGTDLLERDFSNWCSAIVVFSPHPPTIEGAFVSLRTERGQYLYYTTRDGKTFKKPLPGHPKNWEPPSPLKGPAEKRTLRDASVCLYAQKSGKMLDLLALGKSEKMTNWLREIKTQGAQLDEPKFRFYNFAGNPMMVRLADGVVDVVLELGGQSPHDVVPGAYIALLAGAVLSTPNGEDLSKEDLAEKLLLPAQTKVKYVLSANETMHSEMIELLSSGVASQ